MTLPASRTRKLNLDNQLHLPKSLPPPASEQNRTVYIFQDGETHFAGEGEKSVSHLLEQYWPSYVIYHMSRPLCEGEVWEKIRPKKPFNPKECLDPDRLIVIVHADDLRAEGIELFYSSSWEKTCEDFVRNLGAIGRMVTLATCPNLIVVFGCDGIIYHRGLDVLKPILIFDPSRTEGEFYQQNLQYVPGVMEAFVAGFAKSLVQSDIADYEDCIAKGFQTARNLARNGISVNEANSSIYDASKIMELPSNGEDPLIRLEIPSDDIGKGDESWSLLDSIIADSGEIARRIVLDGISSVNVPSKRFNRLVLFDRKEIHLFQILKTCFEEYLAVPQTKPLSMALFGPRGSGKAHAALQLVETAARGRKIRQLIFDLSEFNKLGDLVEAFHQIRDCTLEGCIPFAFFKNFDVHFDGSPFGWLPHLLPAMARGRFYDRSISRPIGTALLFFSTSISRSFTSFQYHGDPNIHEGTARNVREFIGYLQGFVDMAGFNRTGLGDKLYPFRRAVVLRTLLEERQPKLKTGCRINVDEDVLSGLLLVPEYTQGIRSLTSILSMSRLNDAKNFPSSALPSETQLRLHVDYAEFRKAMSGRLLPLEVRELLAERLNETYAKHIRERERGKLPINVTKTDKEIDMANYLEPWDKLSEAFKDSNRDHADAIKTTIRIISCFLAEKKEGRNPVTNFTDSEIEAMAMHEKDRWNSERLQRQWKTGRRSGKDKTTPYLVPWKDLDEETKEIDRAMVRSYLSILPQNYAIYRMESKV
ncbi:hypothetical protein BU24DRAFT_484764 [Aaosphaeria arxii CBS 175.79]|uniref:Ryanodine receptor Ryr domain-containing protein n=1 Tax=Aaosphaeria arxii CBS 175.79 TaxID=1450172 RepID=A0A6A5XJ90_9PLEO|nr:uncharacterized protein BU24DRAFT_484764 [Aaosphaeria arxii CBS 175.79]KAF2012897.1 hypothetical protein BU24DRAFT_484764 [Aaosphaeria arxii CBS 175.79]